MVKRTNRTRSNSSRPNSLPPQPAVVDSTTTTSETTPHNISTSGLAIQRMLHIINSPHSQPQPTGYNPQSIQTSYSDVATHESLSRYDFIQTNENRQAAYDPIEYISNGTDRYLDSDDIISAAAIINGSDSELVRLCNSII